MSKEQPRWKRMGWKRPWRKDAGQASKGWKALQECWNVPHELNFSYSKIFSCGDRYKGKPLVGMTEAKGDNQKDDKVYRWKFPDPVLDPKLRYSSFGEVMGTVEDYER